MLPSRMYRNLGIPPPFRSLITIHPALSPSIRVQLRLRLRLSQRHISNVSSSSRSEASATSTLSSRTSTVSPVTSSFIPKHLPEPSSTQLYDSSIETTADAKIEPRLSLTMTCTAAHCFERSTHQFTKQAYQRGIVLVTCPKCKNRHLIADNIGWFKETEGVDGGQLKNIEDIMRAKNEKVARGYLDNGNVIEYVE